MRNVDDTCVECSRRIPPGAPVAIVHTREWVIRRTGQTIHKRRDHWLCLDCVLSNHSTENSYADTGRCEHCEREIRYWDFSQPKPIPSACCAECRRLAANKRSRERCRIEHEPIACAVCGEMFMPTRNDANTCSGKCRQKLYREICQQRAAR